MIFDFEVLFAPLFTRDLICFGFMNLIHLINYYFFYISKSFYQGVVKPKLNLKILK